MTAATERTTRIALPSLCAEGDGDDIYLSIIVPTWNGGKRLPDTLRTLSLYARDKKEAEAVLARGRDAGNISQGQALQLGDFFGGHPHVSRFIAFTAIRHRGQVGTVGFHQHPVNGNGPYHIPQGLV